MKKISIYALCDPDGTVRYIGKASNVRRRYAQHMRENRRDFPVYRWIAKRQAEGKIIPCLILAECVGNDWENVEKLLIAQYRSDGARLLNVADGGNEPKCKKEILAKNGKTVSAAIHSDPVAKRIWELKRTMGELLRESRVSETAKAKLRLAAERMPQAFGQWATL